MPVSQYLMKTFDACHRCPELSISGSTLTSYSCSQVHRAVMQLKGKPREVVVKVRHPGVAHSITVDFRLLKPVAAAASRIPSLKGLSLKESLAQFSANMTAQARTPLPLCHIPRKESWSGAEGPPQALCACCYQQSCSAPKSLLSARALFTHVLGDALHSGQGEIKAGSAAVQ